MSQNQLGNRLYHNHVTICILNVSDFKNLDLGDMTQNYKWVKSLFAFEDTSLNSKQFKETQNKTFVLFWRQLFHCHFSQPQTENEYTIFYQG